MTYQISVYLNTEAHPPVTCCPPVQPVPLGAQEVQWVMAPEQNGSIEAITWAEDRSPFTAPLAGPDWKGTDDNGNSSESPEMYSYTISVKYNDQTYSSDPEIENDPEPPRPPEDGMIKKHKHKRKHKHKHKRRHRIVHKPGKSANY